jgi:hypothetical protein
VVVYLLVSWSSSYFLVFSDARVVVYLLVSGSVATCADVYCTGKEKRQSGH